MYSVEVIIYFLLGLFIVGNTMLFLGLVMKIEEEKEKVAEAEANYSYPKQSKKRSAKVHRVEKDGAATYQVVEDDEDIIIEEV